MKTKGSFISKRELTEEQENKRNIAIPSLKENDGIRKRK